MPNWCGNTLRVEGPAKTVEAMLEKGAAKDTALSFESFFPTPKDLLGNQTSDPSLIMSNMHTAPADPKDDDWYSWRVRNWGTKWDVEWEMTDEEIFNGNKLVVLRGDSAWGPPLNGILNLSRLFPEISFSIRYAEPGMMFRGQFDAQNGEVTLDEKEELTEDYEDE